MEFKNEKSIEFSDAMITYFPVELILHCLVSLYVGINLKYLQIVLCLPNLIYSIKFYLEKRHKIYISIGEVKKSYDNYSKIYKIKFAYYLSLSFIAMIKFFICFSDLLSYRIFGKTNLLVNIITLIGLY